MAGAICSIIPVSTRQARYASWFSRAAHFSQRKSLDAFATLEGPGLGQCRKESGEERFSDPLLAVELGDNSVGHGSYLLWFVVLGSTHFGRPSIPVFHEASWFRAAKVWLFPVGL